MRIFKTVICASFMVIASSCGNDETKVVQQPKKELPRQVFVDQIRKYEAEMHRSMVLDPNTASLAVKAYDDFSKIFPNDSLTPDFIFKAGEISTANQQYPQALMYYQQITTQYPSYKFSAEALYLQGYLLDNFLNDEVKAKAVYEQVIAKYPDLSYATDAKAAIKNLGKSDEELIKEFERKNKKK